MMQSLWERQEGHWTYEFGLKQEGGQVSDLVLASPVIAAAAAVIAPLAEFCWRQGMYFKCLLWWLVLIPRRRDFYASAERVDSILCNILLDIVNKIKMQLSPSDFAPTAVAR